jgi:uncharacterized cupredoxin-like copper-binding protein
MLKFVKGATLGTLMTFAIISPASAATVVTVTLWDKGTSADMATDKGIAMKADKSTATMGVKLSKSTVKAGEVLFKVSNSSAETVHEMVLFPYKDGEKIPYSDADSKINEDAAGHLGEVSELDPKNKGELKITLKRGKYAVLCNIPGHYMNGMWAILTVK